MQLADQGAVFGIMHNFQVQVNKYFATYVGIQWDNSDCVVRQPDGQKPRALFTDRNDSQSHTNDITGHVLPLGVLVQLARLKLEQMFYRGNHGKLF